MCQKNDVSVRWRERGRVATQKPESGAPLPGEIRSVCSRVGIKAVWGSPLKGGWPSIRRFHIQPDSGQSPVALHSITSHNEAIKQSQSQLIRPGERKRCYLFMNNDSIEGMRELSQI